MNETVEKVIHKLRQNNMAGYFVRNKADLISLLSTLIKPGDAVGCGDSVTLEEMGVFEFLRNGSYVFYDKHKPDLTSEEKRELYLKNLSADTFISGTNAVTSNGELFNIDGNGSRVAPMLYGPNQVVIVVGINKLVNTYEDAVKRARQTAAPLDAKRLGKDTPCAKIGRCIDCRHEQRICNDFVLIAGQFVKDRIKVIIVDETLGY